MTRRFTPGSTPSSGHGARSEPMPQSAPQAPLNLVLMGTGPFAVPLLESLIASPHRITAVVTRPDRTAPGRRPPPNPVREVAEAAGLPVIDPPDVNASEVRRRLAAVRPDLLVVCDYGQILSGDTLAVARLGGINLHGSLLPRHRGAAPVQWAILDGDAETGVSVIRMSPALDAGSVILARREPIRPDDTAATLEPRLAALGGEAVLAAIDQLAAAGGGEVGSPQDPAEVTRAPRLSRADGEVDFSEPAARIERRRRALDPWPRAATCFVAADGKGQRLVLGETAVAEGVSVPPKTPPGTVLAIDDGDPGGITVACGGATAIVIRGLVPAGKRPMTAGEFLRGSSLREGTRLG